MKVYQSPLSIGSSLLFLAGAYLSIAMVMGAWPTYFAFIFLGLGIIMFVTDHFIRKSAIRFKTKLLIQSICTVISLIILYLFFSGKM